MRSSPGPQQGDEQNPERIQGLFASIAGRYDLANRILSGGLDPFWRRRAACAVGAFSPCTILDVATGTGDLAIALRRACPGSRVIAADFCLPLLAVAAGKGVRPLMLADALRLPLRDGTIDAVTVAFGLRNMESWTGAVGEFARVLRPGGRLFVLDFSIPEGVLRVPYRLYLHHILPWLAGRLTGRAGAYRYLAQSIEEFPRGSGMTQLLQQCGFTRASCTPMTGGIVSFYAATKPTLTI